MAEQCLHSIQAFSLLLCPAPSPPVNKLQTGRRGYPWNKGPKLTKGDMASCSAVKAVRKEAVGDVHAYGVCLPDSPGNCLSADGR